MGRKAITDTVLDGAFSTSAAREAAALWGFGPDAAIRLLAISENASYVVTDPATGLRYVLRLNRPGYHSKPALQSELAWTKALREKAVLRTPAFVPTLDGNAVATIAPASADAPGRHAVLFTFASGTQPEPGTSAAGMPAIGELAARLHGHAKRWTPPAGFTRFAWDLHAALGNGILPGRWGDWRAGAEPTHVAVLYAAANRTRETLLAYGQHPERYGLIHADLRAANLLVDPAADPADDAVTVVDFDDCGLSWYGYDLAASVSFLEHLPELGELVAGWLAGYRRVGRLDAADVAALPSLVMLRRLQLLAWTASHAETGMARSVGSHFGADTAEVAERYLCGRLLAGVS